MQDDQIDAYFVCIKKKRLVERVSIQIITLKVEKLTNKFNKQLHLKKSHSIVSIILHT